MDATLVSLTVDIEHFALVNYRVPADRIRDQLPSVYDLQTHLIGGREFGFVTTTCFINRDFRPTPLPVPKHTFYESTYRTYVTHGEKAGVYFFGRYLGTRLATTAQRTLARDTFLAGFDVDIVNDGDSYERYTCRAEGERGDTFFDIQATTTPPKKAPFDSGDEHAQFLTYRLNGYFTATGGIQGRMPVRHPRMAPRAGKLEEAHFDLWEELDILNKDEMQNPYSVLIDPGVRFRLLPARPLL